ncbi:hypothetical protein WN55_06836 [Dufourea novaeangliae]|nr:hypothetical protein WN55_06836 [Dufourea novaeangliae]
MRLSRTSFRNSIFASLDSDNFDRRDHHIHGSARTTPESVVLVENERCSRDRFAVGGKCFRIYTRNRKRKTKTNTYTHREI